MSLTKMIQYNDDWKSFFKENIPKKTDFKTLSGHSAFSNDYQEIVEYKLSNSHYSSVVGTAFDYIARWLVAKTASSNSEQAYEDLIAERGIYLCRYVVDKENIDMQDTYEKALKTCKKFIKGKVGKSEIIDVAVLFAKLEQVVRRGTFPFDVDLEDIFSCEYEIIEDLEKLYDLFEERFIFSGLVTKDSKVVYNPTFGGASVICGGADADIYIDGTLYDFKCTKKHGYVWNEVAQILGYYFLDNIAKNNHDEDNCLNGYEIKRIAFYRARHGEIEYIDVSKEEYQGLIMSFEEILGKEEYQKYFEEERKRKEQEKLEQEEREREEQERLQKEQKELEEITRRGNKDEITLYKMKKILGYGDYFDEEVRQCKNEKQKKRQIKWLIEVYYNSRVYDKIDSEKIKYIMQRENITVDEMSKKLNRTPATVKKWIAGKSTPPLGTYIELLEMLKCNRTDIAEPKNNYL